jgi:hypothetical protein
MLTHLKLEEMTNPLPPLINDRRLNLITGVDVLSPIDGPRDKKRVKMHGLSLNTL